MATLLLPSPLLGPATWRPVADLLGGEVVEVDAPPPDGVVDAVRSRAGDQAVSLVTHSNAGLYAPLLSTVVTVEAVVHVDAALATTDPTPLAPPTLVDHMAGLVDARGLLPPWTQWWDDEQEVAALFPDEATRAAVEAEQPRLPLKYLQGSLPAPETTVPTGYVAFGDTYADEVALAHARGWPVRRLEGGHLHQLHDPRGVADAITDLLDELRA